MTNPEILALRRIAMAVPFLLLMVLLEASSFCQDTIASSASGGEASVRELTLQVQQLREMVLEMRSESAQSRAEMQELRQELQDTRKLLAPLSEAVSAGAGAGAAHAAAVPDRSSQANADLTNTSSSSTQRSSNQESSSQSSSNQGSSNQGSSANSLSESGSEIAGRLQKVEEASQLLGLKVDEQYQTKVEGAGKYRMRISGIVLMNAFHNVGASDSLDIPDYAEPVAPGAAGSSFGATLRQSEIGLEVFGPTLAGARSSAEVQLDFAGGFPATPNGVNFGTARLQTASLRLDWEHTSVVAGQDSLFISPLSPTSFASLATPAFAYAGNLWGWTPQIRVERRFNLTDQQTLTLQAGILDNLDWEPPSDPFYRYAQAGEASGQPAYAVRTAWSRPVFNHPLSFAAAGYYGRQDWSWGRYVDAWAGMTDWRIPLARRLGLSGEFYRGRGVGGLGAGIGRSILFGGNPYGSTTPIRGLDSAGGWSQLKFQLTSKIEINGVYAEDNAFAGDVRGFATDANNFLTIIGRNRGELGNVVYRPKSDLLLSAEFRRLHSLPVYGFGSSTNQINLAIGVLF